MSVVVDVRGTYKGNTRGRTAQDESGKVTPLTTEELWT